MVAVMSEILEPEGLGHDLLTEWGQWYRDDREGRSSWAVKPRIDAGRHGEPPERVRRVDKIIARHRLQYWNDWRVTARYYLDDLQPWQIARHMNWHEDRVRTLLLVVCGMIEREFRD